VRRVGESHDRQVDVRVLAATNKDLERLVAEGLFREDLYFRVATIPVTVPPLREREHDVALLFTHFLDELCAASQRRRLSVDPGVFAVFARYHWPGNVRELRNLCEQLVVFATDSIDVRQLPSAILREAPRHESGILRIPEGAPVLSLRDFKEQSEKEYIENVLRRAGWNFTAAARLLEIHRSHLHQKTAALKIVRPAT
jgi:DNA-binding NtrC family response regulator